MKIYKFNKLVYNKENCVEVCIYGKKIFSRRNRGEDILETILGGIILIGIIVLINYFIFKSLGENILRLNDLKTMDPEVLGILIGIFLSTCIELVAK